MIKKDKKRFKKRLFPLLWFYVSFFLFSTFSKSFSQNFNSGFLPDLNFSYKVNEVYSYVQKFESRFKSYNNKDKDFKVEFERFDFQNFLQRKIGLYSKLAAGYQYRIKNGIANEHRSIQQFSWVSKLSSLRVGQRLRSDQTFSSIENPEFRMRYRAKFQLPLQGQQLDYGEYYLIFSDELVWAYQNHQSNLENRIISKIGLYINDSNKVEWSFEWRIRPFLKNTSNHQLWIGLSWYRSL